MRSGVEISQEMENKYMSAEENERESGRKDRQADMRKCSIMQFDSVKYHVSGLAISTTGVQTELTMC